MDDNPYRGPNSGDAIGLPKQKKSQISTALKLLMGLGIIGIVICLLLPAVRTARPAALRAACVNNLKQIALALQNYADTYHALPPAYTTDADGKPLHSWRTLILPFIEEQQLYKSIDLTKPWDDDANAEARKTSVYAYQCPSSAEQGNHTTYLAIVGPNNCFLSDEPRKLSDVTDGASQTLMVIEVDSEHAVPWMAPVDADEQLVLDLGPKSKFTHDYGFNAAFVDGHVTFLSTDLSASQRRALMSIAGNDKAVAEGAD